MYTKNKNAQVIKRLLCLSIALMLMGVLLLTGCSSGSKKPKDPVENLIQTVKDHTSSTKEETLAAFFDAAAWLFGQDEALLADDNRFVKGETSSYKCDGLMAFKCDASINILVSNGKIGHITLITNEGETSTPTDIELIKKYFEKTKDMAPKYTLGEEEIPELDVFLVKLEKAPESDYSVRASKTLSVRGIDFSMTMRRSDILGAYYMGQYGIYAVA